MLIKYTFILETVSDLCWTGYEMKTRLYIAFRPISFCFEARRPIGGQRCNPVEAFTLELR